MPLKLKNTLTKTEEVFEPINKDSVSLYTCGPTVYNYPHIGNYRAYIFGDILKRTLSYLGYNVKHIMNITDIDDKTIRDSIAEGKTLAEFTEFYTQEFYKDIEAIHIVRAEKYTKATDYIDEMVKMIETLIEKGFAYKGDDGSVYFDIAKDTEYGKLSHFTLSDLKENAKGRMSADEYDKENAQDFALWKAWDENDGEVFWETSLGKGRPGWHIECSAMSIAELGDHIDIHTGGVDNMFPHHENEIAQSECATGHQFVKYWMHNEHLMVDGKKMSKSAGNFYTLRDIEKLGITPMA
ncbi:MAG: cysteine--tRNA ligase, partial [Candidatus Pacebacteria bacterium]|nr:cysteine--tRNA ligase [Candidatus Paceibacterota bacterium]